MISAFLEFLQAVKDEENVNTKLRQLHFRIGERFVSHQCKFSSYNSTYSSLCFECIYVRMCIYTCMSYVTHIFTQV